MTFPPWTGAHIPLSWHTLGEDEATAAARVISSSALNDRDTMERFEQAFADYVGARHAVSTSSGSAALYAACRALPELVELPSVRIPALTFHATAQEALRADIAIDLCDVDRGTWVASDCGIGVDYNGVPSDGDIIDAAHALRRDHFANCSAELACYSFNYEKILSTIDGGMVCTDDEELAARVRQIRDQGLVRDGHQRDAEVFGFKGALTADRAAIGLVQLGKVDAALERRRALAVRYRMCFSDLSLGLKWVSVPAWPIDVPTWQYFPILCERRDELAAFLATKGIATAVHYKPIHQHTYWAKRCPGVSLPNAEYIGARTLSLPLFPRMTTGHVERVVEAVREWGERHEHPTHSRSERSRPQSR